MSATFKTSESKREEFRKYLEKEGVLDALTETLGIDKRAVVANMRAGYHSGQTFLPA